MINQNNKTNDNNEDILDGNSVSELESDKPETIKLKPNLKNKENKKKDNESTEDKDLIENEQKSEKEEESNVSEDEISKLRDERLRFLAEMENLRKRNEREKIESIKFGSVNLARDILSPNDNLTRALNNLPEEKNRPDSIKNLVDGIKMVQKEFISILEKHGIKKIDALNKKFDHNFHQAMFEVETKEMEDGIVVQEIQSGYMMHERLLRPTMVGVSKRPEEKKKKE